MTVDRSLFDRSQPLTADLLASRFYSEHPNREQLSAKQARWLSDLWCKHPSAGVPDTSAAGGVLLNSEMQPIGRWALALNPLDWTGRIHYTLTEALTPQVITVGLCSACGGRYALVSDVPDAQHGLCAGCFSDQHEELPYHPLVEGQDNPDGNYGWGEEHAPACQHCGKRTPEGQDTSAYGWLCGECFAVVFG